MTQPQEKMIPVYTFGGVFSHYLDVEVAKLKARDGDLILMSNGKQGRRYRVTAARELPKAAGWRPLDSGGYTVLQLET